MLLQKTPGILIDNPNIKSSFTQKKSQFLFTFLSQCLTLLHPLLNTIGGFYFIMQTMMCARKERKNIIIIQYITLNPVFYFSHYTYTTTRNNHSTPYNNNTFYFLATLLPPCYTNIYNHTQYFLYLFFLCKSWGKEKHGIFLYFFTGNSCFSFKEVMFVCWGDEGGDGEWSKEQQQPVAYHNNGGVILNRLFPTRVMCKAVKHLL